MDEHAEWVKLVHGYPLVNAYIAKENMLHGKLLQMLIFDSYGYVRHYQRVLGLSSSVLKPGWEIPKMDGFTCSIIGGFSHV